MTNKRKKIKSRLDAEVVRRGLADTLELARALIMAGEIRVNGQTAYKADEMVCEEQSIERKEKFPYVSRGAAKIESVFAAFGIRVAGLAVLDIGISNGGFSDYMLQNGARAAVGVDVNIRQVDVRLRADPRMTLIEKNARLLEPADIPFRPDIITMDVSFISILKIIPALAHFPEARVIALVKPQFEAPAHRVERGGVIRDPRIRLETILNLREKILNLNYAVTAFAAAGITGRKGNREIFFLLDYGKTESVSVKIINDAITTNQL